MRPRPQADMGKAKKSDEGADEAKTVRVLCSHCEKILVPVTSGSGRRINEAIEIPREDLEDESNQESDADKKRKNQQREDLYVYITMASIVSLAAIVTVLKVVMQRVMFAQDAVNATETLSSTTPMPE